MFLLVAYALFPVLPFASRNITYRTATIFAVMTMVINTASIYLRIYLPSPDQGAEALTYFFALFLPVFLGCSLVIGASVLPMATLRSISLAKKAAVVAISTLIFLYLSDIAASVAADLLSGADLRSFRYHFIPDFQRIAAARWDYIYLTVNTALAASVTIAIVQRWSKQL
jgi:hypothetical protein